MSTFAVSTAKGPQWDDSRGIREQPGWDEHAAFADALVDRGVIVLGGPVGDGSGDDVGLLLVEASDEDELRATLSQDPWAASGILRIQHVRPWSLWLDFRASAERPTA